MKRFSAICSISLILFGCRSISIVSESLNEQSKLGPWTNEYRNDVNLAGVSVSQYNEGAKPGSFDGKHPGEIMYFFWDGSVRQVDYHPDGSIQQDFWWPRKIDDHNVLWQRVDFTQGSDPMLAAHTNLQWALQSRYASQKPSIKQL